LLKLLLDEHVSPALAKELPRHRPAFVAIALQEFESGSYRGVADAAVLLAARAHGLTLLTYDLRTIPPLLKTWGEIGNSHAGVIFVDRKTLEPGNIGGIVQALADVWDAFSDDDWTNRVLFLTAPSLRL
jgi:hypothetical protein